MMKQPRHRILLSYNTVLLFVVCCLLSVVPARAQIQIGGNVYGGGNAGKLSGKTTVTVRAGDIQGSVYGGARQADVEGSTFVNIDGEHASSYILINRVYGGNDIAGTIGTSDAVPDALTLAGENHVDETWNTFVRVSSVTTDNGQQTTDNKVYIGQLFGGGNGEYEYGSTTNEETGVTTHTVSDKEGNEIVSSTTEFTQPEMDRTYLEIVGGSIIYAFGGGNNVTVNNKTVICVDNPSEVVNSIKDTRITSENGGELLTDERVLSMGVNPGYTQATSDAFQIGSFFGGNNVAEMAIRPTWNLKNGKIRNLYSGGNRGAMTNSEGLLLEIPKTSTIKVDNVYGGCRMADVRPLKEGVDVALTDIQLTEMDEEGKPKYFFPAGLAARVLVRGGDINNVYGGNDISGKVYGGNAVGVYTSIRGDVYGGGNGSYPYTDNAALKNDQTYGDLYYNPATILTAAGVTVEDKLKSVTALNLFRPNAEQVSIRIAGTSEDEPTIIGGGVYVGGNCATLKPKVGVAKPKAELKIGSYAIADRAFLGNNGEQMIDEIELAKYAGNVANVDFSQMNLKDSEVFEKYMDGVALEISPTVVFDNVSRGDPATYVDYTSYFGSFYCGGNVGSVKYNGVSTIDFDHKVVIFDKLVGGSNSAKVAATQYNAAYEGGLLGDADEETHNKLVLNLSGLKIEPKRWKLTSDPEPTEYPRQLAWNTVDGNGNPTPPVTSGAFTPADLERRFIGGNVYGGCCESGIVNGNVVINIDATLMEQDKLFDEVESDEFGEEISLYGDDQTSDVAYNITQRRTGVILGQQGMDVLGMALNVFGGGKGKDTEIWGSTTINLNSGYIFQIFGGSEEGVIGKSSDTGDYTFNGKKYTYNPDYSCYVNMKGTKDGVSKRADSSPDMAECEFIYGGGFFGPIIGNTVVNLGRGRIFNSFAGSCDADILGHTETYIGRQIKEEYQNVMGSHVAEANDYVGGFPWVRDIVYGGNDLGGRIKGSANFKSRVREEVLGMVHKYNASTNPDPDVLQASAYVEYLQGRADAIFGGCYGTYDYSDYSEYTNKPGFTKPRMENAFVNFRPTYKANDNMVKKVYGAGQGYTGDEDRDILQNRSYVLIDIPKDPENDQVWKDFENTEVFGAGAWGGVGMGITEETYVADKDKGSAIIDLLRGQIGAAYGASYKEGVTRRTLVNVPHGSTIRIGSIFGGAYGTETLLPCDVYEGNVEYHSEDACLICNPRRYNENGFWEGNKLQTGAIYGGNNQERRTVYGKINIDVPVKQDHYQYGMTHATIYGAGYGASTWSEYTEVNLNEGAKVYEVYGGGEAGRVLNAESVQKYKNDYKPEKWPEGSQKEGEDVTQVDWENAWNLGGLNPNNASLVRVAEMDNRAEKTYKYDTNVIIHKGASVLNYAYGGGLGKEGEDGSGDVYGTTYIALLGGSVKKDIYAAGTRGGVYDAFGVKNFTASTNAYIEGGTLRNVYGGGWKGDVGRHDLMTTEIANDVLGETNVVIGIRPDQVSKPADYGFYKGVPAIQRNAYSGGEGGAVFGTANLVINNGYIGYDYLLADERFNDKGEKVKTNNITQDRYEAKIDDETYYESKEWKGKDRLKDCGNVFGGGYDVRSSVDFTNITVWNGVIRNSIYGGGEIATIGRGAITASGEANSVRTLTGYYKAGATRIEMYNGHVLRNVFGGGKGYNVWGYGQEGTLYTDGYVFGKTEVHIHGGEVGTAEGVTEGYGNVFGGGDIGYVYSAGYNSPKTKQKTATDSPGHYYYYDNEGNLTEDCKVVVAPMLQVKEGKSVTYDGKTYGAYEYVPTDYLNTLRATKDANDHWIGAWTSLDTGDGEGEEERGIMIHNAVFAGGNVSSNSDTHYANATTVFGNSTATLYDVYHRDFITIGTEHTGGLYGGGNLSVVDCYRELNITNYGTDYYGLDQQITLAKYQTLTNRERAYFKLQYLCMKDCNINGKEYKKDDKISEEDYNHLPEEYKNTTYWQQFGFCSIYAGRLLNTIQRADFCGVFGSRMVLQGAKDRVADVGDATEYTINRVGEVSLNQQRFTPGSDDEIHGNYFGIYSLVNYLGNLTSDVHFTDERMYVDGGKTKTDTKSYYEWKVEHLKKPDRNNGASWNQVALASGVFLELTTEKSTPSKKDYGYITGVVELDLINVKKDIEGGGYVYARNEHGSPSVSIVSPILLSEYNKKTGNVAVTRSIYSYNESSENLYAYQTSGNFIHRSKRIVDDCYPNNGVYNDGYVKSPAHYWYIKGEVYIYDQVVSAYTGSASAYSKEVKIPLTITAGSNGRLTLLNVQPNLYAYYRDEARTGKITSDGVKVDNERVTYQLNDVITWWDWHQLSDNEKKLFVTETYVNVDTCKVGGILYPAGTYVLENDPSAHPTGGKTAYQKMMDGGVSVYDKRGQPITDLTALFHPSNNISHDTGYVLTFDMDSPSDWNDWYSPIIGVSQTGKIKKETYDEPTTTKTQYREAPTFRLKDGEKSGLYGQRMYAEGEIISKEVYDDYTTTVSRMYPEPEGQATVEPAYVAKDDYPVNGTTILAGNPISKTMWQGLTDKSHFDEALLCVNTLQLGDEEYVLQGELVPAGTLNSLATKYRTYNNTIRKNVDPITEEEALAYVESHLTAAYYCTAEGNYGGQYFEKETNYSALKSWCSLTDDRDKFVFNYDAFDLLVDPTYPGEGYMSVYDWPNTKLYSATKPVEYMAVYTGTGTLNYEDEDGTPHSISSGQQISREDFEKIMNAQRHYTRIEVEAGGQNVYIVKENFYDGGTPFAKGQDISEKDYNTLRNENKAKVDVKHIPNNGTQTAVKYYCYEDYGNVNEGKVIDVNDFANLDNYQKYFVIQGTEPTETTTLYVSRESNAKDVTSEKVITVIYQYTYYEEDQDGEGVSQTNELHVVNIHLQLESGAPEIGKLSAPPVVLPGNKLGLKPPTVNPGLYEVLTNGWEMFTNEDDALNHRNGVPFINNGTPLYWYQNQKTWVAFYSKTYLGKTYSNAVPISVANYHDLDAVMKDTEHHMYVDHADVMRDPKIYIDQNKHPETNQLDLLKQFFDLSTGAALNGHAPLNTEQVGNSKNLEFFLRSNIEHTGEWTPIAQAGGQCFMGNLHGDGYTISGLSNSLFGHLCGNVYNLGVTGSFTSAGIADAGEGYVENSWIQTTGTPASGVHPVFGNPESSGYTQVANCYYLEDSEDPLYKPFTDGKNTATKKSTRAFYNGEVAYNLNGFYLNKRYYDNNTSWTGSKIMYKYLKLNADGTLSDELASSSYPDTYAYYPSKESKLYGYVENRFADGDFIYADGNIPDGNNVRLRMVTTGEGDQAVTTSSYAPVWPDDYIFFGQSLNYGHVDGRTHQDYPSHINKAGDNVLATVDGNRVYRAPAYFQSKNMGVAYFNPYAVFAQTKKDAADVIAYKDMTAIDFTGHGDSGYEKGLQSNGAFYPPLLDDGGLNDFRNINLTKNLLVYTGVSTAAATKTNDVVKGYLVDGTYRETDNTYRTVAEWDSNIRGHWVQKTDDGYYIAQRDHLLVDKQDFNAPIGYKYASGTRMWYQRKPDNFVDRRIGWETVSLPFTAELVTTDVKGEITHFYHGNTTGHEYWLREYVGKKAETGDVFTATFNYPQKGNTDRTVTNTFLWDYYYKNIGKHNQSDLNGDIYQEYYSSSRTHEDYPLLIGGTPYIIGFPGKTYYEFDLSGEWAPQTTSLPSPEQVRKQTITFVSKDGEIIGVSDDEVKQNAVYKDNYTFVPNYMSKKMEGYLLNTAGGSFDKTTAATEAVPFRPYFVAGSVTAQAPSRKVVEHIFFDSDDLSFSFDDNDPSQGEAAGELTFYGKERVIGVKSSLRVVTDVTIVNTSGLTITSFTIKPNESIETTMPMSGVYIIRAAGGKYNKKITVK